MRFGARASDDCVVMLCSICCHYHHHHHHHRFRRCRRRRRCRQTNKPTDNINKVVLLYDRNLFLNNYVMRLENNYAMATSVSCVTTESKQGLAALRCDSTLAFGAKWKKSLLIFVFPAKLSHSLTSSSS